MDRIGEAELGGEGVALEPFHQPRAVRRDHVDLRVVHVRVDEAGHDEATAAIDERYPVRHARIACGSQPGDVPVLDQQHAVGDVLDGTVVVQRVIDAVHEVGTKGEGGGHRHGLGERAAAGRAARA